MELDEQAIAQLISKHGSVSAANASFSLKCPFCGAQYLSMNERRSSVSCPYCLGYASRAQALEDYCDKNLVLARRSKNLQPLEDLLNAVGDGYIQFECRRTLRIMKEHES